MLELLLELDKLPAAPKLPIKLPISKRIVIILISAVKKRRCVTY